ncbi:DNA translocase FtsK, partial [Helicobacter pylori]|nr:DNA translocase FtsK [Helicobacter pylori]
SHPPTHYTIYPKKNRFDDLSNPTNPTLKEIKQETKEREPTPTKETLTPTTPKPTTLKPIMPAPAPNTENDNKTQNHKTPNHPKKEESLQENVQEEMIKENLKEEEKEAQNAPSFSPVTPTNAKKPVMVKELSENKEILDGLDYGEVQKPKDYELPT